MLMRCLQKIPQRLGSLCEGLGEFALLLVAPGGFEISHAGIETRHQVLQLVVEAGEVLGETPEFCGIDVGFGHIGILHHWGRGVSVLSEKPTAAPWAFNRN